MNQLLCSTGALITSKNNRNYKLLKNFSEILACDGFEFMMYDSWYENWEHVAEETAAMELFFPVFHVEKRIGGAVSQNEEKDFKRAVRLFEINCHMAQRIGAKKLVFHLWDGLPSDQNIRNNIERYAILNEAAERYGLLLTVENVVCNRENPLKHMVQLRETYPDIAFTFDVKFAQFHNELELACTKEYRWLWEGAVRHVHISDYSGGYMEWDKLRSLHPGEGKIDYKSFFNCLNGAGCQASVTIESTSVRQDGSLDAEKLNQSLNYIRGLMNGQSD